MATSLKFAYSQIHLKSDVLYTSCIRGGCGGCACWHFYKIKWLIAPFFEKWESVICHPSLLTSADYVKCQMSAMTDDGTNLHQYGCLQKRLCKCSNLVEIRNWLDHYVRNESQYGPHEYFPLYIFGISFIKLKCMAPENESLKTLYFFWFHLFRYKGSHMQKMGQNKAFLLFLGHPTEQWPPVWNL